MFNDKHVNNFEIKGIFLAADKNKDNLIDDMEWGEFYEHFIADF
jgi:hypothetical protein